MSAVCDRIGGEGFDAKDVKDVSETSESRFITTLARKAAVPSLHFVFLLGRESWWACSHCRLPFLLNVWRGVGFTLEWRGVDFPMRVIRAAGDSTAGVDAAEIFTLVVAGCPRSVAERDRRVLL